MRALIFIGLVACGGGVASGPGMTPDAAQVSSPSVVDMSESVVALPDLASVIAPADLHEPPPPTPDMLACVQYQSSCSIDAQCCDNHGATGSCTSAYTSPGLPKYCCTPTGHSITSAFPCCPGLSHACDIYGHCSCE